MKKCRRALLADASEEFRTLLRAEIEQTGEFSVTLAASGEEVLSLVRADAPDLLVMDVILPEKDGIGVLETLHEEGIAPPTIFVSSFMSDRLLSDATAAGAAYFLPKPFSTELLLDKMRALFQNTLQKDRPSLKTAVSMVLYQVGVPAHVNGYQYLRDAILMVVEDPDLLHAVTKALYPSIARRRGTTASKVERGLRHAIGLAWERGDPSMLRAYFGSAADGKRPCNSAFISVLADHLALEYGDEGGEL